MPRKLFAESVNYVLMLGGMIGSRYRCDSQQIVDRCLTLSLGNKRVDFYCAAECCCGNLPSNFRDMRIDCPIRVLCQNFD